LDATDANGVPFPPEMCPFPCINEDPPRSNVAFVDGHIVNQILVMTTRDIEPGEELFVDYGHEMDRSLWGQTKSADAGQEQEKRMDDARAVELAGLKQAASKLDSVAESTGTPANDSDTDG